MYSFDGLMTNYLNDNETSFPSIQWNNYDEYVIMSTCMDRSILSEMFVITLFFLFSDVILTDLHVLIMLYCFLVSLCTGFLFLTIFTFTLLIISTQV